MFSCLSLDTSFNPRAHVGRDNFELQYAHLFYCFNPRAHVGRDSYSSSTQQDLQVSIHAPTWGATADAAAFAEFLVFQSTRPRGARRVAVKPPADEGVSIHAPTWGAT